MCPIHHPNNHNRRRDDRLRLATSRLKIFIWDMRDERPPTSGFGFLADISSSGVGVFLIEGIPVGSEVRVGLWGEEGATYRGTVMWSQRYSYEQKFIGHESNSFRVGVRFKFGTEAERQRYLGFEAEIKERTLALGARS